MTPTTPRFRFSTPDGTEVVVASVTELAERIVAGEIKVDTPLYDAGTGLWNPAGTVPVFQFVVEELREEGRLAPGAEQSLEDGEPSEGSESEGSSAAALPFTPDPFELHLPLRSTIPGAEEPPETPSSPDEGEPEEPPPEWAPEFLDEFEDEEAVSEAGDGGNATELEGITWGVPLPARTPDPPPPPDGPREKPSAPRPGDGREADPEGSDEVEPPPFPVPEKRPPRRPRRDTRAPTGPPGGHRLPEADEGPWPDDRRESPRPEAAPVPGEAGEAPRARARPDAALPIPPRRDRRLAVMLGTAGLLVLLVASGLFFSSGGAPDPADLPPGAAPGQPSPAVPGPATLPSPPSELAPVTDRILAALAPELDRWTDSLRVEVALEPGPPREWLGGFYLSHAGDFPSVPEFWQRYREFLVGLGARDRQIYRGAVVRLLQGEGEAVAARERIVRYFDERYAALDAVRADRYAQLIRVSEAAEELHLFLSGAEDRIVHAPALGPGISADPILEAVPLDDETRAAMDRLLDALFQALDRSRGGGAPSFEGLRSELFGRFSAPI